MTSPNDPKPTPGRWTLWHRKPPGPWKAVKSGTYAECRAEWNRLIDEGWSGDFYTAAEGRLP